MSTMVEFASNGGTASGYLGVPAGGTGPGLLVLQEWWGLDPALKIMVDRAAAAGFVALAPDLYHGEVAGHHEMDRAEALMNAMPPDRAARDMGGALAYLAGHGAVSGSGLGVIGFCMGGLLTLVLSANAGPAVKAAVPFYGFPFPANEPDWTTLTAVVRGHLCAKDDFFAPEVGRALEEKLQHLGKDVEFTFHDAGHAFINPTNPIGTHDEPLAERVWAEAVEFLHGQLD